MKEGRGHLSKPGRQVYNPKATLDNSPSQMVYRPKNWNGKSASAQSRPVAQPAKPATSGPRPKPKRK